MGRSQNDVSIIIYEDCIGVQKDQRLSLFWNGKYKGAYKNIDHSDKIQFYYKEQLKNLK